MISVKVNESSTREISGSKKQHLVMEPPADTTVQYDDPIDVLMKEHDEGMEQLKHIAGAVKSIQVDGFSGKAFQEIADAVRVFLVVIRRHNAKEERYLFPLMDRHAAGSPSSMRYEHREIGRTFNELVDSVNDVEDGRIHGSSIRELLQVANNVVDQLSSHMTKENTVVFPVARQILTAEEYEQLRKDIALASSNRGDRS
jgi:hemerythrin-like domain-containing protein